MAKQEALAKIESTYPVLADPAKKLAIMRSNLGEETLTQFDLTRVRVPAGGGKAWSIPSLVNPDGEATSAIEGIIVHTRVVRAFWRNQMPTGDPPDCTSTDTHVGIGDPGGDCHVCPFAQFGSARDESGNPKAGQACKMSRAVFLLRPGQFLPVMLSVPPSSLQVMRQFLLGLSQMDRRPGEVVVKLALTVDQNRDGLTYSKIVPSVVRELDADEVERVAAYASALAPHLEAAARPEAVVAEVQ